MARARRPFPAGTAPNADEASPPGSRSAGIASVRTPHMKQCRGSHHGKVRQHRMRSHGLISLGVRARKHRHSRPLGKGDPAATGNAYCTRSSRRSALCYMPCSHISPIPLIWLLESCRRDRPDFKGPVTDITSQERAVGHEYSIVPIPQLPGDCRLPDALGARACRRQMNSSS